MACSRDRLVPAFPPPSRRPGGGGATATSGRGYNMPSALEARGYSKKRRTAPSPERSFHCRDQAVIAGT